MAARFGTVEDGSMPWWRPAGVPRPADGQLSIRRGAARQTTAHPSVVGPLRVPAAARGDVDDWKRRRSDGSRPANLFLRYPQL